MSDLSGRSEIGQRTRRLLELLDGMYLSNLDFDNREHLQVIELCVDLAIEHAERMRAGRAASRPLSPVGPGASPPPISEK